MSCCSIAELNAGALACSDERSVSVVLNAGEGCEGERRYRTLISLLRFLALMRRVVNYHSSLVVQRQVELSDASGFPGYSAGRGADPARGAPEGG
ncbi:Myosin family protein with Dil domain [Dorcoceras hygrometricum]|uniref:Myosin family protein with Dil domain n=1 Tax=Dorcoceras hygrometricum TaxID=472368 RepID=A0A2Z7BW70_9LAMI|nr:Myosin family protein with Dil domain [Dorcoceras hygrometricum]